MRGRSETSSRSEACTRRRGAARQIERQHFKLHIVLQEEISFFHVLSLSRRRENPVRVRRRRVLSSNMISRQDSCETTRTRCLICSRLEATKPLLSSAPFKLLRTSAVRATRGPPSAPRKRHTESASAERRRAKSAHAAWRGERRGERPAESERIWAPCLLRSETISTTRRCGVRSTTRPSRARRRARRRSRCSRTASGRGCLTCRTRPDRRGTPRTKTNNRVETASLLARLSRPPGAPRWTCAPRATVGMRIPDTLPTSVLIHAVDAVALSLRSTRATTTACAARARRMRRRRAGSFNPRENVLARLCASSWRWPRTRAECWWFCPRDFSTPSSCAR